MIFYAQDVLTFLFDDNTIATTCSTLWHTWWWTTHIAI